jgi:hypothetical protein
MLALITPAYLVFAWSNIDALEVLLAALDALGIVGVVCGIVVIEGIKEVVDSILSFFDHLEHKTVTEAITTVVSTFGWDILGFTLAPTLIGCILVNVLLLDAHGSVVASSKLGLVGPLFPCLPLSHLLECVKLVASVWSIQKTEVHNTSALASCFGIWIGCVTAAEDQVPGWK